MKCLLSFLWLIGCTITLCTACRNDGYSSPEGYNLKEGKIIQLGKVLNEISGISYNIDNNSLLAISDSKEKIFQINLNTQKLKDYAEKFAGQNDYEDLVKLDTTVFLLVSNGTIIAVPKGAKDTSHVQTYPFWSTAKNDFETLYYDPSVNGLIMLCKSCAHEKGEITRTAYIFDLATRTFDSTAFFTISSKEVQEVLKDDDINFKPSAAAIHPFNKRLYILASAGNLLVVADTRGTPIEAYKLNPDLHPQAEGIAFAPNGDMYITNEGKYGKPTLQIFRYFNKSTTKKSK